MSVTPRQSRKEKAAAWDARRIIDAERNRAEADNRRLLAELERAEAKLTGLLVEIRDATVTAAQVEAAAKALVWHMTHGCKQWDDDPTDTATSGDRETRAHARTLARECFRAAGYRIEETP